MAAEHRLTTPALMLDGKISARARVSRSLAGWQPLVAFVAALAVVVHAAAAPPNFHAMANFVAKPNEKSHFSPRSFSDRANFYQDYHIRAFPLEPQPAPLAGRLCKVNGDSHKPID